MLKNTHLKQTILAQPNFRAYAFKSCSIGVIAMILGGSAFSLSSRGQETHPPAAFLHYRVQKGQTLGEILFSLNISPLWGPKGNVRKVWLMNQDVIDKEGDLVLAGTNLLLPLPPIPLALQQPEVSRAPASAEPPAIAPPLVCEAPAAPIVPVIPELVSRELTIPPNRIANRAPAATTEDEDDIPHALGVSVNSRMTTLQTKDQTTSAVGTIYSGHDVSIAASWSQFWSESFSTFAEYAYRTVSFKPSSSSSKTLSGLSQSPQTMSLGGRSRLSDRFSLIYSASYGQQIFAYGSSSSTLTLETLAVPSGSAELTYKLLQKGRTQAGAKAGGTYYGGATSDLYSAHSGYGFVAGGFLHRMSSSQNTAAQPQRSVLGVDVEYFERHQNSSILDLTEKGVALGVSFSFRLFGGEKEHENK